MDLVKTVLIFAAIGGVVVIASKAVDNLARKA